MQAKQIEAWHYNINFSKALHSKISFTFKGWDPRERDQLHLTHNLKIATFRVHLQSITHRHRRICDQQIHRRRRRTTKVWIVKQLLGAASFVKNRTESTKSAERSKAAKSPRWNAMTTTAKAPERAGGSGSGPDQHFYFRCPSRPTPSSTGQRRGETAETMAMSWFWGRNYAVFVAIAIVVRTCSLTSCRWVIVWVLLWSEVLVF